MSDAKCAFCRERDSWATVTAPDGCSGALPICKACTGVHHDPERWREAEGSSDGTLHLVRGKWCDVCGPLDNEGWPIMFKDERGQVDQRYGAKHPISQKAEVTA